MMLLILCKRLKNFIIGIQGRERPSGLGLSKLYKPSANILHGRDFLTDCDCEVCDFFSLRVDFRNGFISVSFNKTELSILLQFYFTVFFLVEEFRGD